MKYIDWVEKVWLQGDTLDFVTRTAQEGQLYAWEVEALHLASTVLKEEIAKDY